MPSQPAWFHRLEEIFTALRALPAFGAAETLALRRSLRNRQRRSLPGRC